MTKIDNDQIAKKVAKIINEALYEHLGDTCMVEPISYDDKKQKVLLSVAIGFDKDNEICLTPIYDEEINYVFDEGIMCAQCGEETDINPDTGLCRDCDHE